MDHHAPLILSILTNDSSIFFKTKNILNYFSHYLQDSKLSIMIPIQSIKLILKHSYY
jgi:hypothetical protein